MAHFYVLKIFIKQEWSEVILSWNRTSCGPSLIWIVEESSLETELRSLSTGLRLKQKGKKEYLLMRWDKCVSQQIKFKDVWTSSWINAKVRAYLVSQTELSQICGLALAVWRLDILSGIWLLEHQPTSPDSSGLSAYTMSVKIALHFMSLFGFILLFSWGFLPFPLFFIGISCIVPLTYLIL